MEDFAFLVEKEEMWARMLMEVLKDQGIPVLALPLHGAGLVIRSGIQERLRVYVAPDRLSEAQKLERQLFPEEE